jgi:hypothetical protein
LNADYAGSNATGAQSLFGVGVTLSASTVYEFEALYVFQKTAGATLHNFQLGFGGTATNNNILFMGSVVELGSATVAVADSAPVAFTNNSTTALTITSFSTANVVIGCLIRGTVSINAGGTFIPQYTLSAAPGGAYSTVAGSFIRINPLSASGAATNVGTWA